MLITSVKTKRCALSWTTRRTVPYHIIVVVCSRLATDESRTRKDPVSPKNIPAGSRCRGTVRLRIILFSTCPPKTQSRIFPIWTAFSKFLERFCVKP